MWTCFACLIWCPRSGHKSRRSWRWRSRVRDACRPNWTRYCPATRLPFPRRLSGDSFSLFSILFGGRRGTFSFTFLFYYYYYYFAAAAVSAARLLLYRKSLLFSYLYTFIYFLIIISSISLVVVFYFLPILVEWRQARHSIPSHARE